jgi:hypothetical protein
MAAFGGRRWSSEQAASDLLTVVLQAVVYVGVGCNCRSSGRRGVCPHRVADPPPCRYGKRE